MRVRFRRDNVVAIMASTAQPPGSSNPPAPTPKPWINTRSAHNVRLWIRENIKEGRLKNCRYLLIHRVQIGENDPKDPKGELVDTGRSFFVPNCGHHSFESKFAHLSDDSQLHILESSLNQDPISCPKNCTYFESRSWGNVKFLISHSVRWLCISVVKVWKEFAALSWQTQIAIIGLLVLLISPRWAPLIVSVAKAVWGK